MKKVKEIKSVHKLKAMILGEARRTLAIKLGWHDDPDFTREYIGLLQDAVTVAQKVDRTQSVWGLAHVPGVPSPLAPEPCWPHRQCVQ